MREQSFETRLERVLRTEADLAVRQFDAWAIANGAASTPRAIGGWRTLRLLGATVALLGLLAGAALLAGSLIDRSPSPLRVVLVARSTGLFAGDPASSSAIAIVGDRQVVDVERSPSGRFVAIRWMGSNAQTGVLTADIIPLDGGAAPERGPSGELRQLAASRVFDFPNRATGGAVAIAWAPVPLGGRELLAVLSTFNGFVVLDSAGRVVVDHPQTADAFVGAGVAWSSDTQAGTLGLTWTSGRDIWRTTIQSTGESSTRLVVRLSDVDAEVSGNTRGSYVRALAASGDGRRIVATIGMNLWLIEESGAATLMANRVADDGWLSFSPDGQQVLATVLGPSGDIEPATVVLPVAGGPGSPIDTSSITVGVGRIYGRWLPDGRILLGRFGAWNQPDDDTRQPMAFWVIEPGGRPELITSDAFDVDLPR